MYKLRLIPKPLTLVKIDDRVLYRADGVTQVTVVSSTISVWILVGSMVMNCFPSYDNLVVPFQKNLFRSATSFANYQRTRLA